MLLQNSWQAYPSSSWYLSKIQHGSVLDFRQQSRRQLPENVGTFELVDSNTRFATGNSNYVTHTLASSNAQWTMKWTPPAGLTEDVRIYAGGNAADGRFTPAADYTYETEVLLQYAQPSSVDQPESGDEGLQLKAYPNPAGSQVFLEFELAATGDVRLEIFDLLGRLVYAETPGSLPGEKQSLDVDVSGFSPGVYVGSLTDGRRTSSTTFTVLR